MISALKGDGVGDFLDWCATRIPLGPWHFPEDQLTDLTLALTAAEVTREKLFLRIHDEIPYNATVETEKFTDPEGRLLPHRPGDLRHPRQPQEDRPRRRRPDHQGDRRRRRAPN